MTLGMTGFDSVTSELRRPPFGIAVVPVTHMLHTISANKVAEGFRKAAESGEQVARSLFAQPAYALAA